MLHKRQEQNADRAQRREPDAEEMINELVLAGRTGIVQVVWVMKEERSERKHLGRAYPMGKGTEWTRNTGSLEWDKCLAGYCIA